MIKRILKEWVLPTILVVILVVILVGFGYRMAHAEDNDDYVKAPEEQTKDAIPPVSFKDWKDKKYLPVKIKPIPSVIKIIKKPKE